MKILVIIPRFAIAGVPLAQIRFARALRARGHFVELIIGHIDQSHEFSPPEELKVTIWNKPKVRGMFVPLVRYLLREKPDVVFSAEDHLNILVQLSKVVSGSKALISGSCRVTPFDTYSNKFLSKGWLLKLLAKLLMRRADVLTCVSKDMVEQYQQVFKSPPHQCVYNIVDDAYSRERLLEPLEHPWFKDRSMPIAIAAGRLAHWKGFSCAIEAIRLLPKHTSVKLLILGDGPLRNDLQLQIDQNNLSASVQLMGNVKNPLKYFASADLFILSSLVEGMPNVLVEAMMSGCTPVATDCPTGPRELLKDGQFGYLVPMNDPKAMAKAIIAALDCPIPKQRLEEAVAPFKEEAVLDRHFELLGISE